jgi:hypothetical protein
MRLFVSDRQNEQNGTPSTAIAGQIPSNHRVIEGGMYRAKFRLCLWSCGSPKTREELHQGASLV